MQENKKNNAKLLIYLVIFFIALCTYGFGYYAGSNSDPLKVSQVMEASDEANRSLHAELSKCREELTAFQMRLRINTVAQMDSILADIKAKYAEYRKSQNETKVSNEALEEEIISRVKLQKENAALKHELAKLKLTDTLIRKKLSNKK